MRGWFSAKQGPQPCQWEIEGDPAGSIKLTVSVCSLCRLVPSSALGSHGLQRGRDLGAESRFSAMAAHPGPLPTCLAPPPPQPQTPRPTVSPARLSPCPAAWQACWAHAGTLVPPRPCSSPCSSPRAPLGAPDIAPRALHSLSHLRPPGSGGYPSEQGPAHPSPVSSWSLPHPTSRAPPALPTLPSPPRLYSTQVPSHLLQPWGWASTGHRHLEPVGRQATGSSFHGGRQ